MRGFWKQTPTLEGFIDDVMRTAFGTATNPQSFSPDVDIRIGDEELSFICDVPGIDREHIEVTFEDDVLTIRGSRTFEPKENEQVLLGRSYGSFARSFKVPDYMDSEKLTAELAHGVLTIRIPKQSHSAKRKIPIGGTHDPGRQLNE